MYTLIFCYSNPTTTIIKPILINSITAYLLFTVHLHVTKIIIIKQMSTITTYFPFMMFLCSYENQKNPEINS